MGYKLIQQSNNIGHDIYELVVDSPADLDALPNYIGAGSTAIILSNDQGAEVRMKTPSGKWVNI